MLVACRPFAQEFQKTHRQRLRANYYSELHTPSILTARNHSIYIYGLCILYYIYISHKMYIQQLTDARRLQPLLVVELLHLRRPRPSHRPWLHRLLSLVFQGWGALILERYFSVNVRVLAQGSGSHWVSASNFDKGCGRCPIIRSLDARGPSLGGISSRLGEHAKQVH